MSSITPNQLAAILCIILPSLGIITYLSVRAMINSKFNSIDTSEKKLIDVDKKFITMENDLANAFRYIKNNEADIQELHKEFKLYTSSINTLTETISSFEHNSKEQHREIKGLVNENNKVISSMLIFLEKHNTKVS